jgi:LAGLIDADG endonuclease
MLENPSIRQYSPSLSHPLNRVGDVGSDNLTGAENQQERLTAIGWVVGFVDGEGCFSCPIYRCHKMTLGWQVRPEFAVVQGASSRDVLEELVQFFGCGKVFRNRRHDNHREDLFRYCVQRIGDLRGSIVPFFEQYPLRTAKVQNFRKFAGIVELMGDGRHLTVSGLMQIAGIAETMNHRKPSEVLRILRDHTPAFFPDPREEEEMVRTLRRRREVGGNDQPAV